MRSELHLAAIEQSRRATNITTAIGNFIGGYFPGASTFQLAHFSVSIARVEFFTRFFQRPPPVSKRPNRFAEVKKAASWPIFHRLSILVFWRVGKIDKFGLRENARAKHVSLDLPGLRVLINPRKKRPIVLVRLRKISSGDSANIKFKVESRDE